MNTLKKFLAASALFFSGHALAADVVVQASVDGETVGVFNFLLEEGGEGAMQFESGDADIWLAVASEDGQSIQIKGLEGVQQTDVKTVSPEESTITFSGENGERIELDVQFLE